MGKVHLVTGSYPGCEYPSDFEYILCDHKERFVNAVACSDDMKHVTCKNCIRINQKLDELAAKGAFV